MSRTAPGRTVLYRLTDGDVVRIAQQRAERLVQGNTVQAGDEFPALIVKVWDADFAGLCNLQVFLDGPDVLWVTSRHDFDACEAAGVTPDPSGIGCYRFPVPEAVRVDEQAGDPPADS